MDNKISNEVKACKLALSLALMIIDDLEQQYEVWWEISIAEFKPIEEAKELIEKAFDYLGKAHAMIYKSEVENAHENN